MPQNLIHSISMVQQSDRTELAMLIGLPSITALINSIPLKKAIATWYTTLKKPGLTPFVWGINLLSILFYLLMGVASWWVWGERKTRSEEVEDALLWYAGQLGLTTIWSYLFFGLRLPVLALFTLIALWGVVWQTVMKFSRLHGEAAWLVIPYLGWLTLFIPINIRLLWLNRQR